MEHAHKNVGTFCHWSTELTDKTFQRQLRFQLCLYELMLLFQSN
jgi:hypothetical protein